MTGVKSNAVDDSFYRYFTGSSNYLGFMLIMPGSISDRDKKPCLFISMVFSGENSILTRNRSSDSEVILWLYPA